MSEGLQARRNNCVNRPLLGHVTSTRSTRASQTLVNPPLPPASPFALHVLSPSKMGDQARYRGLFLTLAADPTQVKHALEHLIFHVLVASITSKERHQSRNSARFFKCLISALGGERGGVRVNKRLVPKWYHFRQSRILSVLLRLSPHTCRQLNMNSLSVATLDCGEHRL